MWPDPNDEADGRGVSLRPRLIQIGRERPRWIRWPGRWGGARARWWLPLEQSSPRGPAFQGERWSPEGWSAKARDCQAECDRPGECDLPEHLMAGGALAAAVGAIGLGGLRRRRRR